MKKIINKILFFALALITAVSCGEPDNAIYDVLDNSTRGAVLRTLERVNNNYSFTDLNSKWEIIVEEQDMEDGELLDKVNVYVSYSDKTDDGVDNNKAEVLVKTIVASEFTTSPNGLPMTTIAISLTDALTAVGFDVNGSLYTPGDEFKYRLEVVLTDGRAFSSASASGSLQGSFFSSPFAYTAAIVCPPIAGAYAINMQDSYGDGWQGGKIVCTIDDVRQEAFLADYWSTGLGPFSSGSDVITIPAGAASVYWEFEGDAYPSEVTFQIYGPNSGAVVYDSGASPAAGEITINYCNE